MDELIIMTIRDSRFSVVLQGLCGEDEDEDTVAGRSEDEKTQATHSFSVAVRPLFSTAAPNEDRVSLSKSRNPVCLPLSRCYGHRPLPPSPTSSFSSSTQWRLRGRHVCENPIGTGPPRPPHIITSDMTAMTTRRIGSIEEGEELRSLGQQSAALVTDTHSLTRIHRSSLAE